MRKSKYMQQNCDYLKGNPLYVIFVRNTISKFNKIISINIRSLDNTKQIVKNSSNCEYRFAKEMFDDFIEKISENCQDEKIVDFLKSQFYKSFNIAIKTTQRIEKRDSLTCKEIAQCTICGISLVYAPDELCDILINN